jgi:phage baseplate assembly protein W
MSLDRFGTGLARPLRYAPGGFVTASGPEKVLMTVEALLAINVGSLPWRCGVGTRLMRLRHLNNYNDLRQLARVDASDALDQWEPRFRLSTVTVAPLVRGSENKLELDVYGHIVGQGGKAVSVKVQI